GAGFEREDVAGAFCAGVDRERESRMIQHGRGPSTGDRLLLFTGIAGVIAAGAAAYLLWAGTYPSMAFARWTLLLRVLKWAGISAGISGFLAVGRMERRRDLDTRIWLRFWNGPLGRFVFGLARLFVRPGVMAPAPTHRPAALALALAAEALFQDLPAD